MNPITAILAPAISEVFKRLWPDPAQQAQAQLAFQTLQQNGDLAYLDADLKTRLAQIAVDNTEAQSESLFKSGWRPFMGWTCGGAFAWNFVAGPALTWALAAAGHPVHLPLADLSQMMPVVLGLLGLGTLRTIEKVKGAQ
ncbi:hypothetical protein CAter10_2506 [Collimonas arenae]|uniref:3TM-type holin n=1 Tax=Collimonas arenae TaxID=279058 RepID=UPI0007785670|nr:3TM-type holin [Collimonas arenae]AMP00152.1 hypothetical protein CAter10_2506 [Collimonas arenae]